MSKRFNQIEAEHFASLVQEINISKYSQKEFRDIVEEIYMCIFRHNTKGEYVIETMPNDKTNWKVYKDSQTIDEALKIIKEQPSEK